VPLKQVPIDFPAFEPPPARFITVCTDCGTGQAVYYGKDADHLTVLRASASLPFMSPMVDYDGRKLLDGAIADAIPPGEGPRRGFAKNVVVLTHAPSATGSPRSPAPPARIVYRKYPKLVEP
jgi:predicted patatin/cPLA2 family phospholipase